MNRLASFYSVSAETLSTLQPPTFETMPNVGVPKPAPTTGERFSGDTGGSGAPRHVRTSRPRTTPRRTSTRPRPSARGAEGRARDDLDAGPSRRHGDRQRRHASAAHDDHSWPAGARDPGRADRDRHAGSPPPGLTSPLVQGAGKFGANGNKNPFTAQARTSTSNPSGTSRAPQGRERRTTPWGVPPAPGRARHAAACRAAGRPARPVVSRAVLRVRKQRRSRPCFGTRDHGRGPLERAVGGRPTQPRAGGQTGSRVPRGTVMGEAPPVTPGRHRPHRSARCHGRPGARRRRAVPRERGAGFRAPPRP